MATSNVLHDINNKTTKQHKHENFWAGLGLSSSSIHHHHELEFSKYPEIETKHANIINKHQATRIWCPFSSTHLRQNKSMGNIFVHKNENSDLTQHS